MLKQDITRSRFAEAIQSYHATTGVQKLVPQRCTARLNRDTATDMGRQNAIAVGLILRQERGGARQCYDPRRMASGRQLLRCRNCQVHLGAGGHQYHVGVATIIVTQHIATAADVAQLLVGARLMGVMGTLQQQDGVIHVVAGQLQDHSALLGSLVARSRDFHLPTIPRRPAEHAAGRIPSPNDRQQDHESPNPPRRRDR